jgi:signal transduction histidine kinase
MSSKGIRRGRISVKLTLVYALMFSIVLLALNASVLYGIRYYLFSQTNSQIQDMGNAILQGIESGSYEIDISSEPELSAAIFKSDGTLLSRSSGFAYDLGIKQPYGTITHVEKDDKHLNYITLVAHSSGYGTVYVQVVKNMKSEYGFMDVLFIFMSAADLIGMVASLFVGYAVSRRMLQPITDITRAADNISIKNLKERIDVAGPDDELKKLGVTFNSMIDRLQDSFDRQVRFVSDASHELRTPIAVIQGYADLLDRWGKNDPEALEKSIRGIKLEAGSMGTLVEKLLFLAKSDSSGLTAEKKDFNSDSLVRDVVQESSLIDGRHRYTCSRNDPASVFADYSLLKQMLRIFIDNSMKFAPEGSTIDISSEAGDGKVSLSVRDEGPGIPEADLEKIFDRFYTVDKSRSRETAGTGLGLSIARKIADLHGAVIKVESLEGSYTKITVELEAR